MGHAPECGPPEGDGRVTDGGAVEAKATAVVRPHAVDA